MAAETAAAAGRLGGVTRYAWLVVGLLWVVAVGQGPSVFKQNPAAAILALADHPE